MLRTPHHAVTFTTYPRRGTRGVFRACLASLAVLVATTGLPIEAAKAAPTNHAGFEIPAAANVRSLGDIGTAPTGGLCQIYPQYCAYFPVSTPGMGIPLGGIGAGNFMINQSGTFGPWWFGGSQGTNHAYEVRALPQAAFHLYEKVGADAPSVTTLATDGPVRTDPAQSWQSPLPAWNRLSTGDADYSALYPFGWMDYNTDKLSENVQLRFYSPIVAGEDRRTSLPVAYFDLRVTNNKTEAADVSAMFTMPNVAEHEGIEPTTVRNGLSSQYREADGIKAVTLSSDSDDNTPDAWKSEWTIAAKPVDGQTVSYVTSWNANGDGSDIYSDFSDGSLTDGALDSSASAGAIAVSAHLQPGETTTIPFVMTWDFPQVAFQNNSTVWMRRYTEYYGAKSDAHDDYVPGSYPFHQSYNIAKDALADEDKNLSDVLAWWQPIVDNANYPSWLKEAALNQVANVPFHTALWENGLVSNSYTTVKGGSHDGEAITMDRAGNDVPGTHNYFGVDANSGGGSTNGQGDEVGIYSEIVYSSLFPNIERDRMVASAEAILSPTSAGHPWGFSITEREGEDPFIYWSEGDPYAAPGKNVFLDTPSNTVYRMYDYAKSSGDKDFLKFVWPAMKKTFAFLQGTVPSDYALPEDPQKDISLDTGRGGMANVYNTGYNDARAFDSYNSSLYILALEAMIESGKLVGEDSSVISGWKADLTAARSDFEKLFWMQDKGYYRYRTSVADGVSVSTDPMVATFLSQWLAERAGLDNVVDYKHYETHLETVQFTPTGNPMSDFAYAAYQISAGKTLGNDALVQKGLAIGEQVAHDLWHDPSNPLQFNAPNGYGGFFGNLYPGWEGVLSVWQIFDSLDTHVSKAALVHTLDDVDSLQKSDYTESSWTQLLKVRDSAVAAMWSNSGNQAQVDAVQNDLLTAVGGLALRASDLAPTSLLIEVADSLTSLNSFTPESSETLKTALAQAKADYDARADRTQAQLDATAAKLKAAIEGLKPKAVTADKTVLQHVYDGANGLSNADGSYTQASWSKVQSELVDAKRVLDDPAASQLQIDSAVTELSTAVVSLQVAQPVVTKVKLNQSQLRLVKGKSFVLKDAVYYSNGKAAYAGKTTWSASNTKIASVTSDGVVKARRTGTVTIIATAQDMNASGERLSASIKVTVVKSRGKAKITKVAASVPKTMKVDQTVYITGKYISAKATGIEVKYATSKPDVVFVDRAGRLVAMSKGTAFVKVTAGGKTKAYKITVK